MPRRRSHGPADSLENRSLFERCLTRGVPEGMLPGPYNNNMQVVQTPGYVMIFTEMIHDARIVPIDGRPHVGPEIRKWMGDSRGHWEGNTLVVDTTNFTDKTSFRGSGANLHVIERFTRLDADTLEYRFTVDDPTTWTKPWTVAYPDGEDGRPDLRIRVPRRQLRPGRHPLGRARRGADGGGEFGAEEAAIIAGCRCCRRRGSTRPGRSSWRAISTASPPPLRRSPASAIRTSCSRQPPAIATS